MDCFLFDARIWRGGGDFCDAMIVRGDRIAAMGTHGDLYPRAEGCSCISCGGRTVIPAFSDACLCLMAAAGGLPAGKAGLKEAVQTAMAAGQGGHLFWRWEEQALTNAELEAIWPHDPLFLEDVAARRGWANEKALQLLTRGGLPRKLEAYVTRDGEGDLTGALSGPACRRLSRRMPRTKARLQRELLQTALQKTARAGITRICSIDRWLSLERSDLALLEQLYREGHPLPEVRFYAEQAGRIKTQQCGSIVPAEVLSQAMWQPGQLLVPTEDGPTLDLVLQQLTGHTAVPGNFRRLTLLGCPCTTPEQLTRMGRHQLGVIAFPDHLEQSLLSCAGQPPASPDTCCAWRTLDSLGAHVAFGGLDGLHPMEAVQKAICRPGKEGLSRSAALGFWTRGSAWTDFREDSLGVLRPGYLADLQVLDRDVFSIPQEEIGAVRPVLVMGDGCILHREI